MAPQMQTACISPFVTLRTEPRASHTICLWKQHAPCSIWGHGSEDSHDLVSGPRPTPGWKSCALRLLRAHYELRLPRAHYAEHRLQFCQSSLLQTTRLARPLCKNSGRLGLYPGHWGSFLLNAEQPTGCMWPRIAMNMAQHTTVSLLKVRCF